MLKRVRYAKEVRATSVCVCVCVCGRKQRQNVQLVVVTVRHEWQFRCDHKCVAETVRLVAISSKFY